MSSLVVETQGLKQLAADCAAWSSEIAATGAPGTPEGSAQATAAAISAVHTTAGLTARMLSDRMRATAAKLTIAALAYTAHDIECAVDALAIGR